MMTEQRLNRTGGRPIYFYGEEILNLSTKETDPDNDNGRPHGIKVFKTKNGYRVGIAHMTYWEGERDTYFVIDVKNKKGVLESVRKHVPELEQSVLEKLRTDNERLGGKVESDPL